jgi:flavin-dependent dehydrogenase
MDLRLMQRAAAAGVEVCEGTSASLVTDGDRASGLRLKEVRQTASTATQVRAALVVDASGRGRALSRDVIASPPGKAKLVAFKTHATGVDVPSGRCEIFSYRGGYGGTNSVEGGLHNICFIASSADVRRLGSNAESVFRETVCSNERAKRVFRDVRFKNEWLAVPIDRFGRGDLVPLPGLLAIGDAASFIDPFTGSGMLLALESSRLAAECVLEAADVALEYQKRYSAVFDRRLMVCSWIRRVSLVPFMTEATVLALKLSTTFRDRLVTATRSNVAEREEVIR